MPKITVILSTFNDSAYLPAAVDSILAQSFTDFDLLLINDGSTDFTADYLDSLSDSRIRIIHNRHNLGLAASLNLGLDQARGEYIARMDADDIADPARLQKQLVYLESHADVGILGTSRLVIDETAKSLYTARATVGDIAIRWKCLLGNPFAHPTVMLRREVLEKHSLRYDPNFRSAQDYELWTRLLPHTRAENLAEPLLRYRHRDGISRLRREEQLANHDRISHGACRRLLPGFPLTLEQVHNLRGRFGGMSVREAGMNPHDAEWVNLRLAMLHAFVAQHASADGIDEWARDEKISILSSAKGKPGAATAAASACDGIRVA